MQVQVCYLFYSLALHLQSTGLTCNVHEVRLRGVCACIHISWYNLNNLFKDALVSSKPLKCINSMGKVTVYKDVVA